MYLCLDKYLQISNLGISKVEITNVMDTTNSILEADILASLMTGNDKYSLNNRF